MPRLTKRVDRWKHRSKLKHGFSIKNTVLPDEFGTTKVTALNVLSTDAAAHMRMLA